jgi:nucleoside-diphosphate-sugar epimerase
MGQLGRRVTQRLLERGRTVIALDLPGEGTTATAASLMPRPGQPGTLLPAYVNLLDRAAVAALLATQRPAAIVHLAAIVSPPCYKNPVLARKVNVEGTRNLVDAAKTLTPSPLFVEASSAAVYGSRNPHRHSGRVTSETPVNPIECYGEDKVAAERIVADSGLPYAILRLAGIISPDSPASGPEYFLLMRATPRDNRVHAVDARDAALAFANATEKGAAINGRILLIGGDDSYALLQHEIEGDAMEAMGLARLGPKAGLPGDPADDRGWGLTDWFDTTEAQALLDFQKHHWKDTLAWLAEAQSLRRRAMLRAAGPILVRLLRAALAVQRRLERRGRYAEPWVLISQKFGKRILAPTDF